jgi:hypothetical protein
VTHTSEHLCLCKRDIVAIKLNSFKSPSAFCEGSRKPWFLHCGLRLLHANVGCMEVCPLHHTYGAPTRSASRCKAMSLEAAHNSEKIERWGTPEFVFSTLHMGQVTTEIMLAVLRRPAGATGAGCGPSGRGGLTLARGGPAAEAHSVLPVAVCS